MAEEGSRVKLRCPECNGVIGTAPENDLPAGDLVCPACGAIVEGPSEIDELIGAVKHAIKRSTDHTPDDNNSDEQAKTD